jgi:hypothetical protein
MNANTHGRAVQFWEILMHPPHATAESATRLDEQYLGASLGRVHGNRYAAYAAANNNYVSGFFKQRFIRLPHLRPALLH